MLKNIRIMVALALTGLLFSCGGEDKSKGDKQANNGSEFPRSETLYIGGWDWAAPNTFNPLAGDPNFPVDGNVNLMYEALFGYNQMTGVLEPLLGKSYEVKEKTVEVVLDERAKWSDGSAVTTEDVVYSFELDKMFSTPRHSNWNYLSKVEAADSNKVVFTLNPDKFNPLIVLDMISEVNILPKAVFSSVVEKAGGDYMKVLAFKNDTTPVVSGPYNLYKYYTDKIILKRVDNYWGNVKHEGKAPAPKFIIHSLYSGNNHFSSAMNKGNLDMSSIFLPRIWTMKKNKVRAWSQKAPYHVAGSIPTVFMSLTIAPFDDVAFRRALAHAVDFKKIKTLAMSEYTPDMKPGFILPFPSAPESKFYNEDDAKEYGYTYDLEKAKEILKEAGYSWNAQNKLVGKDGKEVRAINLECPQGWSDWENTLKILRDDLIKLGIKAQERFVDYGIWDKDLKQGTFDLIMKTQTADLWPSTPWKRFQAVMTAENWKPVGETMNDNYGRFKDEAVTKLLNEIPTITDSTVLVAKYRELNKEFMTKIPVLPLMYRPTQFYQFSEAHWTNFPTEEKPYAPPQCLMIGGGITGIWGIKPVTK